MHLLRIALLSFLAGVEISQAPQTVSIQGIVVESGNRGPLAGVQVELRRTDGAAPQSYAIATSADGSFALEDVRPGPYRLLFARTGYLAAEYGQRRPGGQGVPVMLVYGQKVQEIHFELTRAGIISGRIQDAQGLPVAGAAVRAMTPSYQDGRRALKVVNSTITDDLGEYRLFGLIAGRYYLSATPTDGRTPIVGLVYNGGVPGAVLPMELTLMDRISAFASLPGGGDAYVPIYFPGSADARSASPIDLRAGAAQAGVDFTAAPLRTRHVRGVVLNNVDGASASVSVSPVDPILVGQTVRGQAGPNGRFDIAGLVPGVYVMEAVAPNDLMGRVAIDVGERDVENVAIALSSGVRLPGRVVLDDRPASGGDPDLERIFFTVAPDPFIAGMQVDTYNPFPDGSFTLGAVPGDYRIDGLSTRDPVAALQNAYLKSVRLGNADVLNGGLHIGSQTEGRIEIVIGTKPGSLEGTVGGAGQQPAAHVTVVLVPDPARRRRVSTYVTGSTDASGRFRIQKIPPGDYTALSWEEVEAGAWQDPEFLRLYEDRGKAIRIDEAGRHTLDLTVIPFR